MTIALDQRHFVMSHLQREVPNLSRYEPGDPAPYVNCRPWGAVNMLAGNYSGPDKRLLQQTREVQRAVDWTLKNLAAEGTVTLHRADGIIAGVWLGQPLGNTRARIPVTDREAVMRRDRHRCVLCDAASDLTIDHIFPVVHGGSGDQVNLRVLCRSCNSNKGASLPDEIRLLGRKRPADPT